MTGRVALQQRAAEVDEVPSSVRRPLVMHEENICSDDRVALAALVMEAAAVHLQRMMIEVNIGKAFEKAKQELEMTGLGREIGRAERASGLRHLQEKRTGSMKTSRMEAVLEELGVGSVMHGTAREAAAQLIETKGRAAVWGPREKRDARLLCGSPVPMLDNMHVTTSSDGVEKVRPATQAEIDETIRWGAFTVTRLHLDGMSLDEQQESIATVLENIPVAQARVRRGLMYAAARGKEDADRWRWSEFRGKGDPDDLSAMDSIWRMAMLGAEQVYREERGTCTCWQCGAAAK
jgi:hypothetical protein